MSRVRRQSKTNLTLEMGLSSLEARRKADLNGLPVPQQPSHDQPRLPNDLTELDDSELMTYFRKLTAWANWLASQLALAQVDERYAEERLKKIEAFANIANKGEKNVTTAKALAYEDEDYVEAKDGAQQAYAYRKLVESLYNSVDRDSQLVSRELTRRVGRNDRDNRASRWTT